MHATTPTATCFSECADKCTGATLALMSTHHAGHGHRRDAESVRLQHGNGQWAGFLDSPLLIRSVMLLECLQRWLHLEMRWWQPIESACTLLMAGCVGTAAKGKADELIAAAQSAAEQAAIQPVLPEEQMGKETENQSKASAAEDDAAGAPLVDPATLAKQQLAGILAAGVNTGDRDRCSNAPHCEERHRI